MKQLRFAFIFGLVIVTISVYGQSRGKYKDGNSNRSSPLTTFDRGADVYSKIRDSIRSYIKMNDDPFHYAEIYQLIYNNANIGSTNPIGHCYDAGVCNITTVAKDAAFVYLMGFDESGDDLDGVGDPGRTHFYEVARDILKVSDDKYGSFSGLDNHQWRAKELMQLLQAHDYLTVAKNAGITSYAEYEDVRVVLADFTYELYSHANNIGSTLDRYSNLTLITAGAIGMAACILSDKGTYFWRIQKRPERWANAAHAYINRTLWTGPSFLSGLVGVTAPRSNNFGMCDSCVAGYAEGPGYFQYGFEALLPFFVTFQNFLDQDQNGVYYTKALNFNGERVRNYVYEPLFEQNLYKWIKNISLPNGDYPTVDDTRAGYNMSGTLALARKTKEKYNNAEFSRLQLGGVTGLQLRQDYLGAFNHPVKPVHKKSMKYPSGDLIIRKVTDSLPTDHYLHVNVETELNNGGSHEHGDISNFIVAAGEDVLVMDPPYFKYDDRYYVAPGNKHNLITIDGEGPDVDDFMMSSKIKSDGGIELQYAYWNYHLGNRTSAKAFLNRNFHAYDEGGLRYYEIDDEVQNNNWYDHENIQFNLNGNGSAAHGSCNFYPGKTNTVVWNYPCEKDHNSNDNYKMQVSLTTLLDSSTTTNAVLIYTPEQLHGNAGGDNNFIYNTHISSNTYNSAKKELSNPTTLDGEIIGSHSRMIKAVSVAADHKVQFKTTIQVLGCNENQTPPLMVMNNRYTSHLLGIATSMEMLYNYHFTRNGGSGYDTVHNPLAIDTTAILKTNAKRAFFSYSSNRLVTSGRCISYSNFRKASITDGDSLIYHDTVYISSNNRAEAYYKFVGKFKYTGYAQITNDPTIVKFFLPDLISGYEMTAYATRGEIDSVHYDTATRTIAIWMPAGYTEFSIELADPCLVSCYFPSTAETIISTFLFDDGTEQTLGHKLNIMPLNGNLVISNGSKMEITCNKYLRNRDSLILQGICDESWEAKPCKGVGTSYKGQPNSAIIVKDGSALVLDNNSYTYVGNNTMILIQSGGTLIIKNGAFLQIGSKEACGKGQIIADEGAYIYIQPNAHIEFYKTIGDTVDKHLLFFKLNPAGHTSFADVGPAIDSLLKADTIIPATYTVTPICSLNTVMAPAVYNNDWGYANFMPPVPNIYLKNDTLCPGEEMIIDLKRVLNDNRFWFKVCRMDSVIIGNGNGGFIYGDTCIIDSVSSDSLNPEICYSPHGAPDRLIYRFKTNSRHRVTIQLDNDCGHNIDSTFYVFAQSPPAFSFSVPPVACAGIGTVIATIWQNFTGTYSWDVDILDSSRLSLVLKPKQSLDIGFHSEFTGTIPDSFDFPGFNFQGARKYLVSLTVTNACGELTKYDTVDVPAGAYIRLERPTAYAQPVNGAVAIKLHGYVSLSDSFRWEPTTWLDTPTVLTPISTPLDSITYVLISHSGSCVATDTTYIKYNHFANAGYNDTLCYDTNTVSTETLIGFPYDMSLFLGILYYYNPTGFMSYYNAHNSTNNPAYLRYFTHYMHYYTYKDQSNACPTGLYDLFTTTVDKELFFKQRWYKSFYQSFTSFNNNNLQALSDFNTAVIHDSSLSVPLDGMDTWTNVIMCIDGIFLEYDNYLASHTGDITASWSKIADQDTTSLTLWDNYFIAVDAPTITSTYILSVITPDAAEIDEITIYLDTALTPGFISSMQFDSSAYLGNSAVPLSDLTSYEWNFGDGSAHSFDLNPIHTFPAFDSNYVVCLIASNHCGSWTFCDTVRIDSAHLGGEMFTRKTPDHSGSNNSKNSDLRQQVQKQIANGEIPIALTNYPNPLGNTTIIDYQIWQGYTNAELRITDILGQQVFSQKLLKPIDKIQIDGSALHDGLYYYSIIIDGSIKQTRSMAVIN
ncbi:MAG: T9SS type A sorting domain-containing protein [Bacteroidia bacterium]|nr:T9SS type A sorting domain-containing protein [Bacteroidia bacterium]